MNDARVVIKTHKKFVETMQTHLESMQKSAYSGDWINSYSNGVF